MTRRNRTSLVSPLRLVVGSAAVALAGWAVNAHGQDAKEAIAEGQSLLKEGDAAADRGEFTEAVVRYKRGFEKLLPGMRKLPFKTEVKRDVTAREDLKGVILEEIDKELSPAEFRADELGMKALGLIPGETDLKAVMVKVYSEEIAAFYDTRTKTMHLIKEPEAKANKPPTFLERLMGKTGGFDKEENKTVIAHELTHALADQNFDIDVMQKAVKNDDDQSLALSALIEGEATLTMIGAQMKDWDGTVVRDVSAATLDRVFSLMMPLMPMAGGKSLREAPVILSETMIFPYLRGLVFCARLTNDGGWDALNEAYRHPPVSTEQVIHPEKYKAEPDLPTTIDLGTLETAGGWNEVGRNVVGEMQLGVMLRRHGGKSAAAGWDGDRYAVFEAKGGNLGLVWFSTWDTENDAREFQRGYLRFQTTKLGAGAAEPEAFPEASRRPRGETIFAVERRGVDVVVVEGFSADSSDTLVDAAFRSKKTEWAKTPPSTKAVSEKPDGEK